MNKFILTLGLLLAHTAVSTFAQPITVEFAGEALGGHGVAPGAPLTGAFTYDPRQGLYQSSTQPIFSFDIVGSYSFRLTAFTIGVLDNYSLNIGDRPVDGLRIGFSHPLLDSGAGMLQLVSYNTDLFNGTALPSTLPSIDQFDAWRSLNFHRDFGDINVPGNYWAVSTRIDQLAVVPEPAPMLLFSGACLLAWWWRSRQKLHQPRR